MRFTSRILVVVFLVGLLSFMTVKVLAGTWLIYDDGGANSGLYDVSPNHLGVEFMLPYGQTHQILTISFYIYANPTSFRAHIYSSDAQTDLFTLDVTPLGTGYWLNIYVSTSNIMVRGYPSSPAFLVTIEYLTNNRPEIGLDTGWLYRHSLAGTPGHWIDISDIGNVMIRAETERIMFREEPPSSTTITTSTITSTISPDNVGFVFLVLMIPLIIIPMAGAAVFLQRRRP